LAQRAAVALFLCAAALIVRFIGQPAVIPFSAIFSWRIF
jgi:hypothetical protein